MSNTYEIKDTEEACHRKALYLYRLSGPLAFVLFFTLIAVVVGAGVILNILAKSPEKFFDGIKAKRKVTATETNSPPSSPLLPQDLESQSVLSTSDHPPPYNEAAGTQATTVATPVTPASPAPPAVHLNDTPSTAPTSKWRRNPKAAECFVAGTVSLAGLILAVLTQALTLQNAFSSSCNSDQDSSDTFFGILFWLAFIVECFLICLLIVDLWIHLFLDLWGQPPKNGTNLHTAQGGGFFRFLLHYILLLPRIVGVILVNFVRCWQMRCCPEVLEEEAEEEEAQDLELGISVIAEQPVSALTPDTKSSKKMDADDNEAPEEDEEEYGGESSRLLQ